MVESNKYASFNKIQKIIHRIARNSGVLIFIDPSKKLSKKENFLQHVGKIHALITIFFTVSTLYIKRSETINIILSLSLFTDIIVLTIQVLQTHLKKEVAKDLLKWCENLYDIKSKFNSELFYNIANTKLEKVQKFTEIVLIWFEKIMLADAFLLIISAPFALVFLRNIVPKFSTAIPFYLPFENQNNWVTFFLTVFMQSVLVICCAVIMIFIYNFFFCIVSHIIGYLDIIQEIVETVFKNQIVAKVKHLDDVKPAISTGTLKMETLMEINNSIEVTNKNNELEFTEWMQILCDMITEINCQINSLKLLYEEFFLLSEMQSFGSLFICGFIFTILRDQYSLLVIANLVIFLFLFCYIYELILQKFEDIEEGLYDIPWYFLSIKEQRMLLIALNCSRIQEGFTAAGVHTLTLDRFATIIKAGYSNFLVLKDLCT